MTHFSQTQLKPHTTRTFHHLPQTAGQHISAIHDLEPYLKSEAKHLVQLWYEDTSTELRTRFKTLLRMWNAYFDRSGRLNEEDDDSDKEDISPPTTARFLQSSASSRPPPTGVPSFAAGTLENVQRKSMMQQTTYGSTFRPFTEKLDGGSHTSRSVSGAGPMGLVPKYMEDTLRKWSTTTYRAVHSDLFPTKGDDNQLPVVRALTEGIMKDTEIKKIAGWMSASSIADRMLFEDVFRAIFVFHKRHTEAPTTYHRTYTEESAKPSVGASRRHAPVKKLEPIKAEETSSAPRRLRPASQPPTTYRRQFASDGIVEPMVKHRAMVHGAPFPKLENLGKAGTAYQDQSRWAGGNVMHPAPPTMRPNAASASVGFRVVGRS